MPTDRQGLRFAETVEEGFAFLEGEGLRPVQSEPTFVRFESDRVFVNVYHGRKSFEIGLEVGSLKAREVVETPYSMSEIIRLMQPDEADRYRNFATHSPGGVQEGVRRLASLFRDYIQAGLLRDPEVFVRLKRQRAAWSVAFAHEVEMTQIRRELDAAWSAKDYARVVQLLDPPSADLTPAELRKLAIARKRLPRS